MADIEIDESLYRLLRERAFMRGQSVKQLMGDIVAAYLDSLDSEAMEELSRRLESRAAETAGEDSRGSWWLALAAFGGVLLCFPLALKWGLL